MKAPNVLSLISVKDSESTILFNPVQLKNALSPISVTESGISIFVNPVQSEKAASPISVTESGISIFVNPVHPQKASLPILTTELGEFLYMAESASVNVEFSLDSNKSYIIFQGFNDSFKKGMKTIFEKIQNLDINTQRCRETLEIQQKDILRRAKNIYLNRNYQVNLEYLKDLVNYNYRSPKDIIDFFK